MSARADVVNSANDTAADNHILGICHLVAGASDHAVDALERSLILATRVPDVQRAAGISTDYALLTDLGTAYLSRATSHGNAFDYVRALETADRAWQLRQIPETSWNRALALQRLHLNDDAKEAWQAYLRTDNSSPWSAEARARLKEIEDAPETNLWARDEDRLLTLSPAQIEHLSELFPLQARRAAEKELLPVWAAAVLNQESAKANACLRTLDAIGATLHNRSGESLLFDTCANIHASENDPEAWSRLAQAVIKISDAKSAYDQADGPGCRAKLQAAVPELIRYRCPLVYLARFYIASSYYFDNDYSSLRREAARLADIPQRYMALHAQTNWILGLGEMSLGRPDNALPVYQSALTEFMHLGESDYEAAIHNLLAEAFDYLDSPNDAWSHRERALDLVSRIGSSSSQGVQLLQGSAQYFLVDQQPAVAKILLDRTLKLPPTAADPLFFTDTISWQAVALYQLGRRAEAEAAWKMAGAAAVKIAERGVRERASNNVTLTRAITLGGTITSSEVQRAVLFARGSDNHWALPRLLQLQADVIAQRGPYEDAMRRYRDALDEIVDQRRKTSVMQHELLNRSCLSDVEEHALSLAVGRGDHEAAFRFSERSAEATFREPATTPLPPVPSNVAILKIVCLRDRILIWTITARGTHNRQVLMPVETVRRAVDEMSAASRPDAASLLGRVIIAPDVIGAAVDTLVIVPDAVFATVPFEALTDPRTGKPLIERYVVAECHSVASYLRATASSSTSPAALLVDGSQPDDMPRLPEAAAEIHQLRQFYPSTTEWRSDRQSIASLRVALEKAGLIHFAAHAIVNHTNELLSNIVLGNKSEILYAHEIAALQLAGHPIVILSTCSGAATAGSRRRRAPTLADAFLAAGASAVVAASDRIDDARARRFSLLLHERLRHGMPVGRAVREIQLAFAREGQPWSDLVVIGNPAAILRLGPS